ncbi:MAG TPA: hypothetical protein VI670_27420 [Thermoanaerobaculia bacterium]|jgi:hypothetical protein
MTLLLVLWLSATTTVLPKGVILVKGATPGASDSSTPVPEDGTVADGRYRNRYFGLSYPIPAGWTDQPAGPPPSDSGAYVLRELALIENARVKAHVQITAQDLFFETRSVTRQRIAETYDIEPGDDVVRIGGRAFQRLAYKGRHTPLRWRMLSTEVRCHTLTFTFSGTDVAALDAAETALDGLTIRGEGPRCVRDYARDHLVARTDPAFPQRYNTIPVRVIVGKDGSVKHVHLLSAFPEQSAAIIDAVRTWRFQPGETDVETGLVFGLPR